MEYKHPQHRQFKNGLAEIEIPDAPDAARPDAKNIRRGGPTPKPPKASQAKAGFGTAPRTPAANPATLKDNGRFRQYPVVLGNDQFKLYHSAWMQGWESFVQRLVDPDKAPMVNDDPTQTNQMFDMLTEVAHDIPEVSSSQGFINRQIDFPDRQTKQAMVLRWGESLTSSLNESSMVTPQGLTMLVKVMAGFQSLPSMQHPEDLRANRLLCSQLLSKLASNPTCARSLLTSTTMLATLADQLSPPPDLSPTSRKMGAGSSIQKVFGNLDYHEEDLTVQCLLHVLIQTGNVWRNMKQEEYKAREWGLLAFKPVQLLLATNPTNPTSRARAPPASANVRGRAMMLILTRISRERCPPHHVEHTRALMEVPYLLKAIGHWYYARYSYGQSFVEVVEEVAKHVMANVERLPAFMGKAVKKTFKFGSPCSHCQQVNDAQPLARSCACGSVFYCTQKCQDDHWETHKPSCKRAWQQGEN